MALTRPAPDCRPSLGAGVSMLLEAPNASNAPLDSPWADCPERRAWRARGPRPPKSATQCRPHPNSGWVKIPLDGLPRDLYDIQ